MGGPGTTGPLLATAMSLHMANSMMVMQIWNLSGQLLDMNLFNL